MVVNSDCRSALFSSAGWRMFFSQACSLADGSRCLGEVSAGVAVCVDPLDCSLMRSAPGGDWRKTYRNITKINAMRKQRKGQACRESRAEKRELQRTRAEKKPVRTKTPGPAGRATRRNYFWPALEKSFSVPTTWPCNVPGMSVSRSTSSPVLASAIVTRLTSRVRPTARS